LFVVCWRHQSGVCVLIQLLIYMHHNRPFNINMHEYETPRRKTTIRIAPECLVS
jgi:hypothetical protein